jgi:hypothetical protein
MGGDIVNGQANLLRQIGGGVGKSLRLQSGHRSPLNKQNLGTVFSVRLAVLKRRQSESSNISNLGRIAP